MPNTNIVKIVIEKGGEERTGYPVSEQKLEEVSKKLGKDLTQCSCGEEMCVGGYIWRCAYGPSRECQWFSSDWRCNEE